MLSMSKALYGGVNNIARKAKSLYCGVDNVARKITKAYIGDENEIARQFWPSGIIASSLAVGSSVYLKENGIATEYLVVNQGKPSGSSLYDDSCDGLWLLRKNIYTEYVWDGSRKSCSNNYKESDINTYINNTFYNLFGTTEKSIIKQVKIPIVNGIGTASIISGTNGFSTKIFLLGGYEVGLTTSNDYYMPIDGAKLSYFDSGIGATAKNKRIANLDGTASVWWLRSPRTNSDVYSFAVLANGSFERLNLYNEYGIRPALVLPKTAIFDPETMELII